MGLASVVNCQCTCMNFQVLRVQGPRPPRPRRATASARGPSRRWWRRTAPAAALLPLGPEARRAPAKDRRAVLRRVLAHDDGPISVLGVVLDGAQLHGPRRAQSWRRGHTTGRRVLGGPLALGTSWAAAGAATRAWRATSSCAATSTTARPRLRATAAAWVVDVELDVHDVALRETSSRDCWMRSLRPPRRRGAGAGGAAPRCAPVGETRPGRAVVAVRPRTARERHAALRRLTVVAAGRCSQEPPFLNKAFRRRAISDDASIVVEGCGSRSAWFARFSATPLGVQARDGLGPAARPRSASRCRATATARLLVGRLGFWVLSAWVAAPATPRLQRRRPGHLPRSAGPPLAPVACRARTQAGSQDDMGLVVNGGSPPARIRPPFATTGSAASALSLPGSVAKLGTLLKKMHHSSAVLGIALSRHDEKMSATDSVSKKTGPANLISAVRPQNRRA